MKNKLNLIVVSILLATACNVRAMDNKIVLPQNNLSGSSSGQNSPRLENSPYQQHQEKTDTLSRSSSSEGLVKRIEVTEGFIKKLQEMSRERNNNNDNRENKIETQQQISPVSSPRISGQNTPENISRSRSSSPIRKEEKSRTGYLTNWSPSTSIPLLYQSVSFEQKDTEDDGIYSCIINCEDEHKNKCNIVLQVTDKYVNHQYAIVTEKDNTYAIKLTPQNTQQEVEKQKNVTEELDKLLENEEKTIEKTASEKTKSEIFSKKSTSTSKKKNENNSFYKSSHFRAGLGVIAVVLAIYMYQHNKFDFMIKFINKMFPAGYSQ